ncbi:MAG: carboxypeptidase regulatory-like domain-containing protein [Planctomycetes bacterium]|nr:carboxypeptidase regulatory-like domain-containing protein [Planctomycetota bacterium]
MPKRTRWLAASLLIAAIVMALAWWPRHERPTYAPHAAGLTAVAGTVVDEAGRPLAGIAVSWFAEQTGGSAMMTAYAGSEQIAKTDADGRFELAPLQPGSGFLAIQPEHSRREGSSGKFELRDGMIASGLRVVAEPIAAARRLRGKLRLPDGSGAPGRSVQARYTSWLGSTWQGIATTDANGVFELIAPWPGIECELSLLGSGSPQVLTTVAMGTEGLELPIGTTR